MVTILVLLGRLAKVCIDSFSQSRPDISITHKMLNMYEKDYKHYNEEGEIDMDIGAKTIFLHRQFSATRNIKQQRRSCNLNSHSRNSSIKLFLTTYSHHIDKLFIFL